MTEKKVWLYTTKELFNFMAVSEYTKTQKKAFQKINHINYEDTD